MANASNWNEETFVVDAEKEYQVLLDRLQLDRRPGLILVKCEPADCGKTTERIRSDLTAQKLAVLELRDPVENGDLLKQVKIFLNQNSSAQVILIKGLEYSLFGYDEAYSKAHQNSKRIFVYNLQILPPVLTNLKTQLKDFQNDLGVCLALLLPAVAINYVTQDASEFSDGGPGFWDYAESYEELIRKYPDMAYQGAPQHLRERTSSERSRRIAEIQKILEQGDCDESTQYNLYREQVELLVDSQEYEAAVRVCDRALEIRPDDYQTWYRRGYALSYLRRYEDAIASYAKVTQIKPDYYEAWFNQGSLLGGLERSELAIKAFDKALEIKPYFYEALQCRGVELSELGRYREAIASYDKALQADPENYQLWFNRGNALSSLGQHRDAIASYDKALEINPDDGHVWYNRGLAFDEGRGYEGAVASYRKAVQIQPDFHSAWYRRGVVLYQLGRYEAAIASLDETLQVVPDHSTAWKYRGDALRKLGRYEGAIASYTRSLVANPNQYGLRLRRSVLLFLQGRFIAALRSLWSTR